MMLDDPETSVINHLNNYSIVNFEVVTRKLVVLESLILSLDNSLFCLRSSNLYLSHVFPCLYKTVNTFNGV